MTLAEIWPSKMRFPMQALIVALSRATDWFEGIPMTAFQVIDMETNMVLSADHFFEDEASSGQTHTLQIDTCKDESAAAEAGRQVSGPGQRVAADASRDVESVTAKMMKERCKAHSAAMGAMFLSCVWQRKDGSVAADGGELGGTGPRDEEMADADAGSRSSSAAANAESADADAGDDGRSVSYPVGFCDPWHGVRLLSHWHGLVAPLPDPDHASPAMMMYEEMVAKRSAAEAAGKVVVAASIAAAVLEAKYMAFFPEIYGIAAVAAAADFAAFCLEQQKDRKEAANASGHASGPCDAASVTADAGGHDVPPEVGSVCGPSYTGSAFAEAEGYTSGPGEKESAAANAGGHASGLCDDGSATADAGGHESRPGSAGSVAAGDVAGGHARSPRDVVDSDLADACAFDPDEIRCRLRALEGDGGSSDSDRSSSSVHSSKPTLSPGAFLLSIDDEEEMNDKDQEKDKEKDNNNNNNNNNNTNANNDDNDDNNNGAGNDEGQENGEEKDHNDKNNKRQRTKP